MSPADLEQFRPPPVQGELETGSESNAKAGQSLLVYIAIAVVCGFYLINPTAGILEFIPDNFPIVGNLDEAAATAGLLYALSGLRVIPWTRN